MARTSGLGLLIFSIIFLILLYSAGITVLLVKSPPSPSTPPPTTTTTVPTHSPTNAPLLRPPSSTITPAPTTTAEPTTVAEDCICGDNQQPLYNTFPHPLHTDASFAVFNFFNQNAVTLSGAPMTVWVTVTVTADGRMQAVNPAFRAGFTYIYLDAQPLNVDDLFTLTIPKVITAAGRLAGGRIYIYYEDPALHDSLREEKYAGHYPVVQNSNATIVAITDDAGAPRIPSNRYAQLLEFTMDVDVATNIDRFAFIDYDLSAVDQIALPVYIFGGYDPRTLPGATNSSINHGFPCGKAYVGCRTPQATIHGCPTQVIDDRIGELAANASICMASFPYCQLSLSTLGAILNVTHWNLTCHKFDAIAAGFGITVDELDFFRACNADPNAFPDCPTIVMPDVQTPSAVIYGCVGQFLLENHCLLDGSRFTRSHLDGTQCSALNRGLCFEPNFTHVPLPDGLSCARFSCPGNPPGVSCLIPCFDYSCFGFLCSNYNHPFQIFPGIRCDANTCTLNTSTNCVDNTAPISKSKVSSCNDSTPDPYLYGLLQNDYSEWVRNKGQRFYGFSLDEEVGGGNQQCLFSTQLDVVIFPECAGNFK